MSKVGVTISVGLVKIPAGRVKISVGHVKTFLGDIWWKLRIFSGRTFRIEELTPLGPLKSSKRGKNSYDPRNIL